MTIPPNLLNDYYTEIYWVLLIPSRSNNVFFVSNIFFPKLYQSEECFPYFLITIRKPKVPSQSYLKEKLVKVSISHKAKQQVHTYQIVRDWGVVIVVFDVLIS